MSDMAYIDQLNEQLKKRLNWRRFFENSADGIFIVSSKRVILEVNRQFCHMFGYTKEEMVGQSALMLHIDAEHYNNWAPRFEEVKGGRVISNIEYPSRRKDGGTIWCIFSGVVIDLPDDEKGVMWNTVDITERKKIEKELSRSKKEWERTFLAFPDPLFVIDKNYKIVRVNRSAIEQLGAAKEHVLGEFCYTFMHSANKPPGFCPHVKTIKDGGVHSVEASIERLGRYFLITTAPLLDENGAYDGTLHIASDITERKAMEQELLQTATTDFLTGVANRRYFIEQMDIELERIRRFKSQASFLLLDLDNFKKINDRYGHLTGDTVLCRFALLARKRMRSIDIFGRLGGEEFGAILPGTDSAGALKLAESLCRMTAESCVDAGKERLSFTVSIGATEIYSKDMGLDDILLRADKALYTAKKKGRNRAELAE